jgi:hypothetical protein
MNAGCLFVGNGLPQSSTSAQRMERICRALAGKRALPLERDALLEMAGNHRIVAAERAARLPMIFPIRISGKVGRCFSAVSI